jgi:hypothetical protein
VAAPEEVMATQVKGLERRHQVAVSGIWAAGIGITLVEMHMGMDYVLSHVVTQMGAIVGWLPMIGTMVTHFWA